MTPPKAGEVQTIAPSVRRVLAPNPGPMTHWGTNTYILGSDDVAVIDPGPDDPLHLAALQTALGGARISHILVTHAHADHSPLARKLSTLTGAPVGGFGPPEAGRSATMVKLAQAGLSGGGEGVDTEFQPDMCLSEGDQIQGEGWNVEVLYTPGHFAGHLAFAGSFGVLSGDHVMDWASSLVSPPDGDIAAFMSTSQRLLEYAPKRLLPGHGNPIENPVERLTWLIDHRRSREAAILHALHSTPQTLAEITAAVYIDVPGKMLPAASRNVFAHLIDLYERKLVDAVPELSISAEFRML